MSNNKDFYLYIDGKYIIHIPAISFEFGLDTQFSVSELSIYFNKNDVSTLPNNILDINDISIGSDDFFVERCIVSNIKNSHNDFVEYNIELLSHFVTDPEYMEKYQKPIKRKILLNKIKKQ